MPDAEYLLTRSTLEAVMAAKARTEQAAGAHRQIASCYLGKLFGGRGTAPRDDEAPGRAQAAGRGAIAPVGLKFANVTFVPENDELTQVLQRID